jgi:glutathione S-transferase
MVMFPNDGLARRRTGALEGRFVPRPTRIARCFWPSSKHKRRGPYFLGKAMSALDLYLWVLATWRPGEEWLAAHCPKLSAIAARTAQHPACKKVQDRNRD